MTDSKVPARPPQVTMAGWVTVVGSAFMVINVFTVVGNLRSLDTRESVQDSISREPLKGTGIDLEQALSLMHVTALVAGACAAAAAILGWFVLRRNHQARVALSVVAVPLFFSGLVAGGFVSSLVAVSVVMLWGRPSRDWFNGITPQPPERRPVQPPTPQGPRSFEGFGTKQTGSRTSGASEQDRSQLLVEQPPTEQRPAFVTARPREVVQACAFTWAMSGVVVLGMITVVIGFALSPDLVKEVYNSDSRFAEADIDMGALRAASIMVAALIALWAVAAMVVTWFAFRGHNWARITLIVSGAVAAAVSLATVISSPPMLVLTAVTLFTVFLLTRRPAVEWYADRSRDRRP